jgi:predicted nuclease of predicted toxin-antitoxin system
MRFLLDEGADARLLAHLLDAGHDAVHVARSHGPGLTDDQILALAVSEDRILITDDTDFGELVFHLGHQHAGVILLRLRDTVFASRRDRLDFVLQRYSEHLHQFVVVTQRRVRIRPRP